MEKGNFDGHYVEWRKSRIKVTVDHYGEEFFKGKTLLEVGCGWGDTGKAFSDLGATVTVSDARTEHVGEAKSRYGDKITCLVVDSESTTWDYDTDFDIIIHWGLLYHLKDPEQNLRLFSNHCKHIVLETEVLDHDDPYCYHNIKEERRWNHGAWGMAFGGTGSRPTPAFVERVLKESGMIVTPLENPEKCNAAFHKYDWIPKNKKGWFSGQRKFWFGKKGSSK
jgi:cyclopropane fatty-acyl-phospholipid synthase-like methyltransferase